MAIKHAFTSAKADGGDTTLVQPSNWNASHTIEAATITYAQIQNVSATDKLLGRSTAGAGSIEEIALTAAGRALIDDIDATTQRTTLGLGTMATADSADYLPLTGGTINGGLIIDQASATNVGLRVTLSNASATGNAFLVEDETNPDGTPSFVIKSSGVILEGNITVLEAQNPQSGVFQSNGGRHQISGTTTQLATLFQSVWHNNQLPAPAIILSKSRGETPGSHAAVINDDEMGYLSWQGSDGTTFVRAGDIRIVVDGTVATGAVPGKLQIRLSDTLGTLIQRLEILADGTATVTGSLNATLGLKENGVALSALYAPITTAAPRFATLAKWGTD